MSKGIAHIQSGDVDRVSSKQHHFCPRETSIFVTSFSLMLTLCLTLDFQKVYEPIQLSSLMTRQAE